MPLATTAWLMPEAIAVTHGGPDATGAARFDFSVNANAAGPIEVVAQAVGRADRSRYPDPSYRALRLGLANWHGVDVERVAVVASASEFIDRFTRLAAAWRGVRRVCVPSPGYGDYAAAARRAGLVVASSSPATTEADLAWINDPASPSGTTMGETLNDALTRAHRVGAVVALDLAYQPLRFDAHALPTSAETAWQSWSPNKACGMPGVRGAYVIAPVGADAVCAAFRAHAPSWLIGADGVAMLEAFATSTAHEQLARQRMVLREWRDELATILKRFDWDVHLQASVTPFFVARPPVGFNAQALRAFGIRARDTASMGLPGYFRWSAQPPVALAALANALGKKMR
ncbi:MAG TPA: pyridoxal phosphate-dependent aminotransferase [Burkholderiaceae bacterium]|nr:pyridoxal phosphate-dependent aminotransferase [Burkholderiaceae bacterium]